MKSRCPSCNSKLDMHRELKGADATPSPGDYSGCIYCGSVLCFDENLELRNLTEEEKAFFKETDPDSYSSLVNHLTKIGRYRKYNQN
jgi:hypothetical protein